MMKRQKTKWIMMMRKETGRNTVITMTSTATWLSNLLKSSKKNSSTMQKKRRARKKKAKKKIKKKVKRKAKMKIKKTINQKKNPLKIRIHKTLKISLKVSKNHKYLIKRKNHLSPNLKKAKKTTKNQNQNPQFSNPLSNKSLNSLLKNSS
jgi:hypothetical protein